MSAEWQMAFALCGVVVSILGGVFALIKFFFLGPLEQLEKSDKDLSDRLLSLKGELPLEYVRRDEWIRFVALVDTKLDTVAGQGRRVELTLEAIKERYRHE
jgi:hypothetical protein